MSLNLTRAVETLEDQAVLQPADDLLHDARLLVVAVPTADDRVEDLDQVQHVLVNLAARRSAEVEKVEQLDLEADTHAADHDVVVVDVAVILAAGVDRGDPLGQHVKYVQRFERAQPMLGLLAHELGELLALDEFADDGDHLLAANGEDLLVVILHQDWAVAQRVELARVSDGGLAGGVAMGVIELGGAADAGDLVYDDVNFAFPATSEEALDRVLSRHATPGLKVETPNCFARAIHVRPHHREANRPRQIRTMLGINRGRI